MPGLFKHLTSGQELSTSKPDLGAVLEAYGLQVSPRYGWVACKCVIHEDSHASAAYNLDQQLYNCLVCNVLGDVYELVKAKENLKGFPDVKRRAAVLANGSSHKILQQSQRGDTLLPRGTRHKSGSGGFVPAWKRHGA